jgi:hypothetical protein
VKSAVVSKEDELRFRGKTSQSSRFDRALVRTGLAVGKNTLGELLPGPNDAREA